MWPELRYCTTAADVKRFVRGSCLIFLPAVAFETGESGQAKGLLIRLMTFVCIRASSMASSKILTDRIPAFTIKTAFSKYATTKEPHIFLSHLRDFVVEIFSRTMFSPSVENGMSPLYLRLRYIGKKVVDTDNLTAEDIPGKEFGQTVARAENDLSVGLADIEMRNRSDHEIENSVCVFE
ncbi:unnamed protein product, partial [Toxocara canis]|uniref:Rad60-SLD_2 domain-containing protein n=1 Tax=Toxocara canis TaxID=6265 RepID=A0A183U748_TOXCA